MKSQTHGTNGDKKDANKASSSSSSYTNNSPTKAKSGVKHNNNDHHSSNDNLIVFELKIYVRSRHYANETSSSLDYEVIIIILLK